MVNNNIENKIKLSCLELGYIVNKKAKSVFKNLSVEFTTGQLIGLVGNNGVGKSTLLKTMAGLEPNISGTLEINNTMFQSVSKTQLAKEISIVLTEKVEGFNLTVYDLVSSGRVPYTNLYHHLTAKDLSIIEECIALVGLHKFKNTYLSELSDGLYQKAMIAKGLAQQTSFLLMDEPSAFLDFSSKHQLFNLLKNLATEKQKCIIVSSHDIDLLLKHSTHLLILDENNAYEFLSINECKHNTRFQKITNNYFI